MVKNGFRHRPVVITALSVAGVKTILMIRKQQYICKPTAKCPQTVTKVATINGIRRDCRIADNVKQFIIKDLHRNISQKELAHNYYVSASTVARTIDTLENTFVPEKDWLPATIAFDDFNSGQFADSGMSMLLMNPTNHRTIDIIKSWNSRYLKQYFYRHFTWRARCAVRLIVVDLYQPYRSLIKELFPHARIIADHFHIVAQAYRGIQVARITNGI